MKRDVGCRRTATFAIVWMAALAGVSAPSRGGDAVPAPDPDVRRALVEGKAALEDGLYELARARFERVLKRIRRRPEGSDLREEVVVLLVRALDGAGEHEEILRVLRAEHRRRDGPPGAAGVFWEAAARYELGQYEAALACLERLRSGEPQSPYGAEAQRLRARCHLATGRTNEALEVFAALNRDYPEFRAEDNLLEWGRVLAAAGRDDEAVRVLGRLAEGPPESSAVQEGSYWLGRTLVRKQAWQEAAGILTALSANENAGDDLRAEALFLLADVWQARTNREEAVGALAAGLERARRPALKQTGGFALGRLLLDMGRLDEAIPLLKSFISESPEDPRAETAQWELAEALLDAGRFAESVAQFQQYLETYANGARTAEAHEGQGWSLMGSGRFAEAATAFGKAQELFEDPVRQARCRFKVGDAYFANGQHHLAAETYRLLLEDNPDPTLAPRARFQLAASTARLGEENGVEAEEIWLQLARDRPGTALAEEALLRVAELRESQGRWAEAMVAFEEVMAVSSNALFQAEALHGRGLVLYRLLKFAEARTDFEEVFDRFPDSRVAEEALYRAALCDYWLNEDEQALARCRGFLDRYPDSSWTPEVLFWLAKYRYNHGEYESAERHFARFVERYPQHALAGDALFRAARSAFRRKEYLQAIERVSGMAKTYGDDPRMPAARLVQAEALCELQRLPEAILVFDEIIHKYPERDEVLLAWGRKGDCQFTLGAEDPQRYVESVESYRVVANSSGATPDLILQANYKIGRSYEKMGRVQDALNQYYAKVIVRYLDEKEKGVWHNEAAQVWFTKAAFDAAAIVEEREEWRQLVNILERVVRAGVPAASEAAERIRKVKSDNWWVFY